MYVALPGSLRTPLAGAREVGAVDAKEKIDVTVLLRGRASVGSIVNADVFTKPINQRRVLSRNEFEQRCGADPDDIRRLAVFASKTGLAVKEKNTPRRTVVLTGTVAAMSAAFKVALKEYEHSAGRYRGRMGFIHIPADLQDVIKGVFGLDNRPQAKAHFRRPQNTVDPRTGTGIRSYTPSQIAALYNFPHADGSGQCIALIELGGWYSSADLSSYWNQLKITRPPHVSAVAVGSRFGDSTSDLGKPNQASSGRSGPEVGVTLDIEVAGSIAPGARIVVYFAENTDAGFLNAITTAVHDSTNNPTIVSISWGNPESFWTWQAARAIHEAFEAAAALGVTVCVAAGDDGSTDGVADGLQHVDFPASSPNALACGGTSLQASGNEIVSETVWNNDSGATGGGVSGKLADGSQVFALPLWQAKLRVPPSRNDGQMGRGIPDVAGNADPYTGYLIQVNGKSDVIGGTGAVASLWAGLIALLNSTLGTPLGYITPFLALFASNPEGFRNITRGNNGAYEAGPGWNPCTGLGTPNGVELTALFASAGDSRTSSTSLMNDRPPPFGFSSNRDIQEQSDPPRSAYALLKCDEAVIAETEFVLTVGLDKDPDPDISGDQQMVRPASSVGPYRLRVQIVADGFVLRSDESWRNELRVSAERPYPSFTLHLTPEMRPDQTVWSRNIQAIYSVDGHTIGVAIRSVAVVRNKRYLDGATAPVQDSSATFAIPTDAEPPDLTVRIVYGESSGRLRWTFDTPWKDVPVPDAPILVVVGNGDDAPKRFARQLVDFVSAFEGKASLYKFLRGIGLEVGDKIPDEFWEALRLVSKKSTRRLPTILILSEEPYIPWELAVLKPPLDPNLPPFLGAQAVVGRWILARRGPKLPPPLEQQVKAIAVVSGVYSNKAGWRRLQQAEDEAHEIENKWNGTHVDAATDPVLKCIEGVPPGDLLHFALHGNYDPDSTLDGLILVDGEPLNPTTVRGSTLAGTPFVFLNACQVGQGNSILGDYAGMAAAFLYAGASGVVAPLWSIQDTIAKEIALNFYANTFVGMAPAEFLRAERSKFKESSSPISATCLAYQFFGHPTMRLIRDPGKSGDSDADNVERKR